MQETIKCPCCGQVTTETRDVRVDLEQNTLYHRGRFVKLHPRLTEMAYILVGQMPNLATLDKIRSRMWGEMGNERASSNIGVAIMQLRRVLPPSLRIVNEYSAGYRMVEVSRTERQFSPVTGAEHARA